jgi:hypothetical protein
MHIETEVSMELVLVYQFEASKPANCSSTLACTISYRATNWLCTAQQPFTTVNTCCRCSYCILQQHTIEKHPVVLCIAGTSTQILQHVQRVLIQLLALGQVTACFAHASFFCEVQCLRKDDCKGIDDRHSGSILFGRKVSRSQEALE